MSKTEQVENEVKAIAVREESAGAMMVGGTSFVVKEQVTVPVLKHESNETIAIMFTLPIVSEKQYENTVDPKTGEIIDEKFKGIINVARVRELSSGQLFQYVLNAISANEIMAAYPNNGYIGKCFAIKKLGTVAGKRYKEVQIVEIEPE